MLHQLQLPCLSHAEAAVRDPFIAAALSRAPSSSMQSTHHLHQAILIMVLHRCLQGGGIFCSPRSSAHKPKLRLLYECIPLALVTEAAGGAAAGRSGALLDQEIGALDETCVVALGEHRLVADCMAALQAE